MRYTAGASTLVEMSEARATQVRLASTLVFARYNLQFLLDADGLLLLPAIWIRSGWAADSINSVCSVAQPVGSRSATAETQPLRLLARAFRSSSSRAFGASASVTRSAHCFVRLFGIPAHLRRQRTSGQNLA